VDPVPTLGGLPMATKVSKCWRISCQLVSRAESQEPIVKFPVKSSEATVAEVG